MEIRKMILGSLKNNTYIAIGEDKKSAVIIDPSYEAERIMEYISSQGLKLKAVLITHGHFDHIGAVPLIKAHMDIPVVTHEEESKIMNDPIKNLSTYFIAKEVVAQADTFIEEGQTIEFGSDLSFDVISVPGHSVKGICYYSKEAGLVFTGDTLMAGSIGRTDYYQGASTELCKSIKEKLLFLPKETIIYPGHGMESTIDHEKKYNPYLSTLA